MMRLVVVVLVASLTSAIPVGAQTRPRTMPAPAYSTSELPPPSIGLTLPPIGLPLPHIGLPVPEAVNPSFQQRPGRGPHRPSRGPVHGAPAAVAFYPGPYYTASYFPYYFAPVEPALPIASNPPPPADPTGTVVLDLQPDTSMQIYVDGYFAGVTDVVGHVLDLDAGPHGIELRADGFEPVAFDVRVARGQRVVYQGRLTESREAAAQRRDNTADVVASGPITLYVIPGCYVGNVPPNALTLPDRCDMAKLTTIDR